MEYVSELSESELACSREQWQHYLHSINASELIGENEMLFHFWVEIQRTEPTLMRLFDAFITSAVKEIRSLACDKSILLESRKLSKLQMKKLYDEMNTFISDERDRLGREMTSQLIRKLEEQQNQQNTEVFILSKEKEVIEQELDHLKGLTTTQKDQLEEFSETLERLTIKEEELHLRNKELELENMRLQNQLKNSQFDLQHHQLLCEKLVTEALNEEDRLKGTIDSLKNKLSHSASLSFTEVYSHPAQSIKTPDRLYKVIMLGDSNAGKTSIINRYTRDQFTMTEPTIDISYRMKAQLTARGLISLQIWDTAGQERFRSIPRCYFRKADGVLLVYDVTNTQSLLNVRRWLNDLDDITQKMIVGNKVDLAKDRLVTADHGRKMADDLDCEMIEVSARTGFNIPQAFEKLSRLMQENEDAELAMITRSNTKIALAFDPTSDEKTYSSCC
ncbi:Oidioi.mRNA.OKI2018_I69.PAR.g10258.t1.cds [Oikopleura dioica]|uniref:Oidioi.mRNA.OKI2018_I69.PAR.g10258.t1.cds n=1 Tax=Oikopleura dioica TaxID=34765 RepID=A0ABN7RQ18_OIKDI|nr:Oidioi.mRNA.OKI2018_I69.PAR.g10258.t1.cds [Oikopleura dioica]